MRPLFTVHAGEFLVGEHIEKKFPSLNIWLPAKDTGIDLLVTNGDASKSVSLQVKLSRDYRAPVAETEFHKCLTAAGWVVIKDAKLVSSTADYWVFVLVSHERRSKPQFLIVPPRDLRTRFISIHGKSTEYHFYPWITTTRQCIHGRGLTKREYRLIPTGNLALHDRDLSNYLNNWAPLEAIA
jgi:hypothetical protein